jgi:hypothetical protein
VTFPHGAAPARRVLAALVLLGCLLAFALGTAGEARASTGAYLEPRFTKTTNTWFFNYNRIQGTDNTYFLCFTLRKDGVVIEPSNGSMGGPGSQNCTGNIYANGVSGETGGTSPMR